MMRLICCFYYTKIGILLKTARFRDHQKSKHNTVFTIVRLVLQHEKHVMIIIFYETGTYRIVLENTTFVIVAVRFVDG